MEVVSDDRSTHNQYHGGQGSREFVHEYRDSDSPQDSPPAQTGRPQSAAFSPRKLSSGAMEVWRTRLLAHIAIKILEILCC